MRHGVGLVVSVIFGSAFGLGSAFGSAACRSRPDPIRVDGSVLRVENQTAQAWSGVEIWVNDHYRVTKPAMDPGEQFVAPLDAFVAGFGQRFDRRKQRVRGVEVTAKNEDGTAVQVIWGEGRRGSR